jgi:hypothetical protein
MSELTQEEALRLADALVGQALKETEARCRVLAQFIDDCDRARSATSAWSEALRELHALHGYRSGLLRRRNLIQQALDCPLGESPAKGPLPPSPDGSVRRTQQQVQAGRSGGHGPADGPQVTGGGVASRVAARPGSHPHTMQA